VQSPSRRTHARKKGEEKAWCSPIALTTDSTRGFDDAHALTADSRGPPCGTSEPSIDQTPTTIRSQVARRAEPRSLATLRQAFRIT
jgi:hypothetical protein